MTFLSVREPYRDPRGRTCEPLRTHMGPSLPHAVPNRKRSRSWLAIAVWDAVNGLSCGFKFGHWHMDVILCGAYLCPADAHEDLEAPNPR